MKRTASSCMVTALFLSACTAYGNNRFFEDNLEYQVSNSGKEAFVSEYDWDLDPEHTDIVIPETMKGAKVTSLGGFAGTGYPDPFVITIREDGIYSDQLPDTADYGSFITYKPLQFNVYVPSTVDEATLCSGSPYFGIPEGDTITFYRPYAWFECDENSKYFYAKDGLLYDKETNEIAEKIQNMTYRSDEGPLFENLPLAQKVRGRYKLEDDIFIEIIACDSRVFMNISDHGNIYASELITDDPSVWDDIDLRETDIYLKPYKNGEYLDEEGEWHLSVSEDMILFVQDDYVYELARDTSIQSMFPKEEDLEKEADDSFRNFYRSHYLVLNIYESDDCIFFITIDGYVTVIEKDTDVPKVWYGRIRQTRTDDLVYVLQASGSDSEPVKGRVHTAKDGEKVIFTSDDSNIFVKEGQDEAVYTKR